MFTHLEHTGRADFTHLLQRYSHLGEEGLFSESLGVEAFGPLTTKAKEALGGWGAKLSLNSGVGFGGTRWVPRVKGEVGSGQTIVLQAICKVKPGLQADFMQVSREIDVFCADKEPGT